LGPIATSTLIALGNSPRFIGSINIAEFFVTITETATFCTMTGLAYWLVITGPIIGRVFAALLAAYIYMKAAAKALIVMVGALITAFT